MHGEIFRLGQLSNKTSLQTRYNSMLAGNASYIPGNYDSIASGTVVGTSDINFSSIPSTYTHLQLRMVVKYSGANPDFTFIRLNSSASGDFYGHYMETNGSSISAGAPNQQGTNTSLFMTARVPGTNQSNVWTTIIVDILDYANTSKYKTLKSLAGYDANGTGYVSTNSGVYMKTEAINYINIAGYSTTLAAGSTASLYGIK